MKNKIKIHDGIVGAIVFMSIVLAYTVSSRWALLAGATGAFLFASAFTGFCPIYAILNKIMPGDDKEKCC